jgi:hypothetical protein
MEFEGSINTCYDTVSKASKEPLYSVVLYGLFACLCLGR